jgi:outer membrane lipoprotein-sorting protein
VTIYGLFSGCLLAENHSDRFDEIKKGLSDARLVDFEVAATIDSKVFDQTDSSNGQITIADDGRYFARMNDDIYLFDGKCIWEISLENKQATKQCLKDGESFENRLFFLKNLDQYYATSPIKKGKEYFLRRIDKESNSLPDSIKIYLDNSGKKLSRLEYFDLNGDINRVHIIKETISDSIIARRFEINLPDSIEIINIP